MKKLTLVAVGLLLASSVQAQTMLVKVLQDSDEIVSEVYKEVPVKSCRVEQIPIYGTQAGGQEASTADVIASAIFGGLLGNQVGGGSGKDAATILGAIAGADMANKKGKSKRCEKCPCYDLFKENQALDELVSAKRNLAV